jgi:ribosomal protein L29
MSRDQAEARVLVDRVLKGTLAELTARLAAVEQELMQLRAQAADSQLALEETARRLAHRETELQELQAQLEGARFARNTLVHTVESLSAKGSAAMQAVDELSAKVAEQERALLILRIREAVRSNVPPRATVAISSKGDDELLTLDGRAGWHFPRDANGAYTGYYPADSEEAIEQLEVLRAKGAGFLLFPATDLWWLDYYSGLREHLEHECREVFREADTCVIYSLEQPRIGTRLAHRLTGASRRVFAGRALGPERARLQLIRESRE